MLGVSNFERTGTRERVGRSRVGRSMVRIPTDRLLAVSCLLFLAPVLVRPVRVSAADRIVLRNVEFVTGTVESLDEDGVRLEDGKLVTWDEIEQGKVGSKHQSAFDKLLKEVGADLYKVNQRLKVADYQGALPHAEKLYPRFVGRKSQSAYAVAQAVMWGRLGAGRHEESLEPYLRCFELLRVAGAEVPLPGERRLKYDPKTAMSPELPPIWFSAEAAKKALPEVTAAIKAMKSPPVGVRIYFASLSLAAGDPAGGRFITELRTEDRAVSQLRDILLAAQEVQQGRVGPAVGALETSLRGIEPANRPLALYTLGTAKLLAPDERARLEGIVYLLKLPALYGKQNSELAAAGLFACIEPLVALRDPKGSAAVRSELLNRYGKTVHAARIKALPVAGSGT